MNRFGFLCFAVVACASLTTGVPMFNLADFQSLPDQSSGFSLPNVGGSSSRSKTAEMSTKLDEFNVTMAELRPKIVGLPSCACAVDTNAELDALSVAVADIEGKCSELAATITDIETDLPTVTDRVASALTNEEFQQMMGDITAIQQTLSGFLETLTASSTISHDLDQLMFAAPELNAKLQARQQTIATCSDVCSAVSQPQNTDDLRVELDQIKSVGAAQLVSGLKSTIEEKQVLATSLLANSMDTSAEDKLIAADVQLDEISSILAANSLNNFATEADVSDLRSSVLATTIAGDVKASYQSLKDFKTYVEEIGLSILAQAGHLRTTDELMVTLNSLSALTGGVLNKNQELANLVSSTVSEAVGLDSSIASALEAAQGVKDVLQTADTMTQMDSLKDSEEHLSFSIAVKELRWNVIKEGYAPSECPDHFEYEASLNMCFFFGKYGNSYERAARYCKAIGGGSGRLISLNEEKRVFISSLMEARGIQSYYWVGMKEVNGQLMWSNGNVDDGTVSFLSKPSPPIGCVEMDYYGTLNDVYCSYQDFFICEIPMADII